jgi:hypothetical protein
MTDTVCSQNTDFSSFNTLYNKGERMFKGRMDYNGEWQMISKGIKNLNTR